MCLTHGEVVRMQEPVFVARPGGTAEDDGWVLVLVNNGDSNRTDLCILDAQHVSDGMRLLHPPHLDLQPPLPPEFLRSL